MTFEELQAQIRVLYQEEEYAAALDLVTQTFDRFPEHKPLLFFWRMAMSARIGDEGAALSLFREALNSGYWYSDALLRGSPSFQALLGEPEFEQLAEINQELREAEASREYPLLTLRPEGRCQSGADPCPLFLALHANASNAQESMSFWRPPATAGWLVAAPQSSQAIWKGAYVWDDRKLTEDEIQGHYDRIREGYAVDPDRIILAGHSMGGEIAAWLALKGTIPARGFIAISPKGPFMENPGKWEVFLRTSPPISLRGCIILEDDDVSRRGSAHLLVESLIDHGAPCTLIEISGAGSEFVPEFEAAMLSALDFIAG